MIRTNSYLIYVGIGLIACVVVYIFGKLLNVSNIPEDYKYSLKKEQKKQQ